MTILIVRDEDGVPLSFTIGDETRERLELETGRTAVDGYFEGSRVTFLVDIVAEAKRLEDAARRFLEANRREEVRGTILDPDRWADELLRPERYVGMPLSERDRALLYGDGSARPMGLLGLDRPAYREPTESDSRQRRRWLARKGKRRT